MRLSLGPEAGGPRAFWGAVAAAVPGFAAFDERPGYGARVLDSLAGRDEPLVLALDDFHAVGSPEVAEELDWLLEHGGELVRLVIATRSDPPMRLERLRMAGRMTEVRATDLAFTLAEAGELLGDLRLSEADLELLWRRTDGWVGGLRLAQLSIEGREDAHEFVTSFAGDDRAVTDYLMSEVVDRQEPDTLDFLLRTCVADRLSAELADALTEGHDGQQRLRTLERGYGLAKALDAHGHWYSLHPLLREVLRAESRRRLPGRAGAPARACRTLVRRPGEHVRRAAPRRRGRRLGGRRRGRRSAVDGVRHARLGSGAAARWRNGSPTRSCGRTPSWHSERPACCSRPATTWRRTTCWSTRTGWRRACPAAGRAASRSRRPPRRSTGRACAATSRRR